MKLRENIVFLSLMLVVFVFGATTFIKTEKITSGSENRTLNTFTHLTWENFLDGSFQNNFEAAISDQFVLSEEIRTSYRQAIASLPTFGLENQICKNHYVELSNSEDRKRGTFNCEDYIVYYPEPLSDEQKTIVRGNLTKYSRLNSLTNAYYYFVNDASVIDFTTGQKVVDYPQLMIDNLKGKYKLATLDFQNYEEYKEYFYKTDHHWDYRGSYQGYLDIAKLLDIKNPVKPVGLFTNHENAFGSHARMTKNFDYQEEFAFYQFDLPDHDTYINGAAGSYNHFRDYMEHNYEYDQMTNYYAYVYGDDYGEVVFDFHQPSKPNLLIISNSYSNAINELIAQHFNKTFVIDLRHYAGVFGKDFDLENYLAQNKIDKTLLLISPTFIRDTSPNRGLEP